MSHQKHIWSEKHRPDTLDEVMKCKSVILKKDCSYSEDDLRTIVEEFEGNHVSSEPRSRATSDVVGVVDRAYYDGEQGIVVEWSLYDGFVGGAVEAGMATLSCSLICSVEDNNLLGVDSVFTTDCPSDGIGETEIVQ